MRLPTTRAPIHPGEFLLKEFLEPHSLTQVALAQRLNIPFQRVNQIVKGKRGITADTALRLSAFFGNSAEFWMNLQYLYDLSVAKLREKEITKGIRPLT